MNVALLTDRIQAAIESALNEGLHLHENDPERSSKLRISGFPFCGVRWFLSLNSGLKKATFMDTRMKYYVSIGHAVHDVLQKALLSLDLPATGLDLYADWKCLKCKKIFAFQIKPEECSCSNSAFEFHEIRLADGYLLGHIDTVFRIRIGKESFFVVIDYKTISLNRLETAKLPLPDNAEQVRAYANEIRRLGKNALPFAFLVYVPRDNPFKLKTIAVDVDFEAEDKKRERYIKRFKRASTLSKKSELKAFVDDRPCRNGVTSLYKSCKLAPACAGSENAENILNRVVVVYSNIKTKLPVTKEEIK
jgi:hypothetical protein